MEDIKEEVLNQTNLKAVKGVINKVRAGLGNMTAEVVYSANTMYLQYLILEEMKEQTALLRQLAGEKPKAETSTPVTATDPVADFLKK